MSETRRLKGDKFANRYRIEGILTTAGPFHLGSGGVVHRPGLFKVEDEKEKPTEVSAVATDFKGRPIIPGSSLKGALRGYLFDVLAGISPGFPDEEFDYETTQRSDARYKKQESRTEHMRDQAAVLDRLFGSPWSEGKIEVWDGECQTPPPGDGGVFDNEDKPPYFDKNRLTYVDQSIAIDYQTHTAIPKRLYHFEVIPQGITFKLTVTGQNLDPDELGMLLFGLEAFNSRIWPLTLGGMAGRGFGRFNFKATGVFKLGELKEWVRSALENTEAGYLSLNELPAPDRNSYIEKFKKNFFSSLEAGHDGSSG